RRTILDQEHVEDAVDLREEITADKRQQSLAELGERPLFAGFARRSKNPEPPPEQPAEQTDEAVEPAGLAHVPRCCGHDEQRNGAEHESDDDLRIEILYRDHSVDRKSTRL